MPPRIRPSALSRGRRCPGYTQLSLVSSRQTPAMSDGELAHKWLEAMVASGRKEAARVVEKAPVALRRELVSFWGWYLEAVAWLYPALRGQVLEGIGKAQPDDVSVMTEVILRVHAPSSEAPFAVNGRADLLVWDRSAVVVADYKLSLGGAASNMEPISEDRQMMAYALGAIHRHPEAEAVTVWRIPILAQRAEKLHIERRMFDRLREAVYEEARLIWANRDTFVPGAHCESCPASFACAAYKRQASGVSATELTPYEGGAITDARAALAFLLAEPVLRARLDEGKAAVRAFCTTHGPIYDPASGKTYQPTTYNRDTIVDHHALLQAVANATDPSVAMASVQTTKTAIEQALKAIGMRPKQCRALFELLRQEGHFTQEPQTRWSWK